MNRNQIGAVVGSQPFGGEGLSGTGPKAGGPHYVPRFRRTVCEYQEQPVTHILQTEKVQTAINECLKISSLKTTGTLDELSDLANQLGIEVNHTPDKLVEELPGPTGETNLLSIHPRGLVLCLGPGRDLALKQLITALSTGNSVIMISNDISNDLSLINQSSLPVRAFEGSLAAETLSALEGFDAVLSQADLVSLGNCRKALAKRSGVLIPLINDLDPQRLVSERHLCVDTTAAGGNASLIAAGS